MSKIGFVLKGYPRLSETFIAQEIYLLEQRGFQIEIFSLKGAREKTHHPVHEKIKAPITYVPEKIFGQFFEIVSANTKVSLAHPIYFQRFFLALFNSVLSFDLDPLRVLLKAGWLIQKKNLGNSDVKHLHSHFVHQPTELTLHIAKITGLSFSISAHAKDIYTSTKNEIRERVRASKFLMTCTAYNYQKIREIVGPNHEEKVNQVYHGVSLSAYQPVSDISYDFPAKRLITVARLVDKKGYDDVFQALVLLRERGIELKYEIYGEGELRDHLTKLIHEMNLSVVLHGAVTQPTVLEAYKKGGIFVLASRESENGDRDGIPNSMAEAMSMALPVVATNVSGIPELLENGKTGLLVSQRSPLEMANALERMYREKGLACRLGAQARQKVTAVFDADHCIDVCQRLLAPYSNL